jgi:competence protein ComEC
MRRYGKNIWRSLPFIRLLVALVVGILLERYYAIPVTFLISTTVVSLVLIAMSGLLPFVRKFAWQWLTGSLINSCFTCIGALLFYTNDTSHDAAWLGQYLNCKQSILITLQETPVEKTKSIKVLASVEAIRHNNGWLPAKGKLYLYFKKDSLPAMAYGTQLLVNASLQPIANTGNPGAFDYRQYCATQDIWGQAYLRSKDWKLLSSHGGDKFAELLLRTRDNILSILKKNIPGEKEAGVAEALLIGYRNDLDKELVRAYSNTGVVHIIAISGLHLGMIYGLILLLLKPFRKIEWIRWVKPLLVLVVLWGFSLLTGAAASILRSAVMFSFIVIGESLGRRGQTLNTLAASAFCLLWYDPYFLWDAGFQLSYAAVASILLFQQPIYRKIYCRNKLLDHIWQLNSVSLSAQILTLPIILYYFHQFPNLFLFTNFIAVPLSGLILYAELLLLVCSPISWLSSYCGKMISFLIAQMNGLIERTDRLPFAVSNSIRMNILPSILLYLLLAALAIWLLQKKSKAFIIALCISVCLLGFYTVARIREKKQHCILVYNIPKQQAIDVIEGNSFTFIGNSGMAQNIQIRNFYLQPARIQNGTEEGILKHTLVSPHWLRSAHKSVVLIDKSVILQAVTRKIPVDLVIFSGDPRISLSQLTAIFDCQQYVFDNSSPLWKIRQWKKQADSLHLRHHSVPEQGAFEMAF